MHSLIGAGVASGPVSTAAVPFSNLVVSIVVACTIVFTSDQLLAAIYQMTRFAVLLLLARKGRRCLVSSLQWGGEGGVGHDNDSYDCEM